MKKTLLFLFAIFIFFAGCAAPQAPANGKANLTVSFTYSKNVSHLPSYAVWVRDESGRTATLYATGKAAKNNFGGAQRPSALPIWSGIREADVDAVSSATPTGNVTLPCNVPQDFAGKKLELFIEANASFDFNDYYKENLKSGEEGYNDVNGQPSVIWTAQIDPAQKSGEAEPSLAGTGEILGSDHDMHDLAHVTTAKDLLQDIDIKYDFSD
jgi:hypothetical protein